MKKVDLQKTEYNEFYQKYISKLPNNLELHNGYDSGEKFVSQFFSSITSDKLDYKYQPEKWSIKEVFQHIIDTERILLNRCFRIAREDKTPLPAFEENSYVLPSNASTKTIESLLNEYTVSRANSMVLLQSLTEKNLNAIGIASDSPLSARAAAFIILGHERWHIDIIKERYLLNKKNKIV